MVKQKISIQLYLLYLGLAALNHRPTSRAARKEIYWVRVLAGSNRKPQIYSSCEKVLALTWFFFFFSNWCVVCGLLWQDFGVVICDCSGTQTHNHLVCKWTLNCLAKLAKSLSCVVSTYLYGAFDFMFLSCHVRVLTWKLLNCEVSLTSFREGECLKLISESMRNLRR